MTEEIWNFCPECGRRLATNPGLEYTPFCTYRECRRMYLLHSTGLGLGEGLYRLDQYPIEEWEP